MNLRYLVRRHGEFWLIVDRQRGFATMASCGSQTTAEWIAELMNAAVS